MYSFSDVDLNLDHTLDCGQVFRWRREDVDGFEWWVGVVNGDVIRARHDIESGTVLVDSSLPHEFVASYFRLDDDLPLILDSIDNDRYIGEAIQKYHGLRLVRQEPWECIISYMLATASSIPTIKKRISLLSRMFGEKIGEGFYSFPDATSLADADESDICECKLGFRAGRIQKAAQQVADGEFCFDELFEMNYPGARARLMEIVGIGEKVADCILLFSLDKMESFPVDTHVRQVVEKYYSSDEYFDGVVDASIKLSNHKMGEWGRRYFGEYCGYAQEYLYYCWRMRG
ncbi:MAG TPA: DNA-3-methyladenine glycosylase 2 family protein [Methanosarcinaceae archaeon]|nr:DNA-3-methyladenine glycosylase 2 family protein [Methanosarcinaceae archaeon]